MKQAEIINKLPTIFTTCNGIKVALLIGSFARNQATGKSDIDYSLWIDERVFNPKELCGLLRENLPNVLKVLLVNTRNKIVVYFNDRPKLELAYYENLSDINQYFLGSEIKHISDCVYYQQPNLETCIKEYLCKITNEKKKVFEKNGIDQIVKNLTDKFIYEFEAASHLHKRSDSYRFYFFYNIALDAAIKLTYLSLGKVEHYYLPKNFAHIYEKTDEQAFFRKLNATLYLPEANKKKRNLLDYFYKALETLSVHTQEELHEIKSFLEIVFRRDFIWNFRDCATICTKLKPNKLFRSSSLTRYQDEDFFADFIRQHRINKVIDLRTIDEYSERPYSDSSLKLFEHLHLSIDPRLQSKEFIQKYSYGTDTQIAYRHYALEHKHIFKAIFEQINPENDIFLIHCHIGRDRTGIVVALLSLLAGEDIKSIRRDYLESEMEAQTENIDLFLETVLQSGSVENYLLGCGVSKHKISHWKKHLSKFEN